MSIFREGILKTIRKYLIDRNEREYVRLHFKWSKDARYRVREDVRFLEYSVTVPDSQTFVGQFEEIFLKESYKFTSPTSEPVIIDCGANIGMSCLYFKRLWPHSRIIAFEPDLRLFGILGKNLSKNGINDVRLVNEAIWVENTAIKFSVEGADGGSVYGTEHLTEVKAVRLKDLLQSHESVDMLKIDIEGAEDLVVIDCGDDLRRVRNIFIEYHSWNGKDQKLGEILSVLEANGFRYRLESTVRANAPLIYRTDGSTIDMHVNVYGFRETSAGA